MKNLIHDITTSLKFLYPCIAYDESSSEKELVIVTETKASKIYPIKKTVAGMVTLGEDYWGRVCFKDSNEQYYCEIDGSLYFKGNDMEGEPDYPVKKVINYELPDIDPEFTEFKQNVEKAKKYFDDHEMVDLVEAKVSLQNSEDIRDTKIICSFKLIIK